MDRRRFLALLGATGAALYVPKRSYFLGPWTRRDDAAYLQALIDQGGYVRLPHGIYTLGRSLVVPSGVKVDANWSTFYGPADAPAWVVPFTTQGSELSKFTVNVGRDGVGIMLNTEPIEYALHDLYIDGSRPGTIRYHHAKA